MKPFDWTKKNKRIMSASILVFLFYTALTLRKVGSLANPIVELSCLALV